MPTYSIRHVTRYRYRQPVAFGEHRLMLRPRDGHDQRTLTSELAVEPAPRRLSWAEDASGNLVGTCDFAGRATELSFTSACTVEQTATDLSGLRLADFAETVPFSYGAEEASDLARFIERRSRDPGHVLDSWLRDVVGWSDRARGRGLDTWTFLTRLNEAIRRDFAYLRRDEKGIQSPVETLRLRRGTCRDFAVLMCEAVRAQGLAARYVSGYLRVRSDGDRNRAAGSTHAWMQVYLPGAGWIDFDPTSGTRGNEGLVRVALVRDPDQAVPLSGSFIGFPSDSVGMDVSVEVVELDRDPGVRDGSARPLASGQADLR